MANKGEEKKRKGNRGDGRIRIEVVGYDVRYGFRYRIKSMYLNLETRILFDVRHQGMIVFWI